MEEIIAAVIGGWLLDSPLYRTVMACADRCIFRYVPESYPQSAVATLFNVGRIGGYTMAGILF